MNSKARSSRLYRSRLVAATMRNRSSSASDTPASAAPAAMPVISSRKRSGVCGRIRAHALSRMLWTTNSGSPASVKMVTSMSAMRRTRSPTRNPYCRPISSGVPDTRSTGIAAKGVSYTARLAGP